MKLKTCHFATCEKPIQSEQMWGFINSYVEEVRLTSESWERAALSICSGWMAAEAPVVWKEAPACSVLVSMCRSSAGRLRRTQNQTPPPWLWPSPSPGPSGWPERTLQYWPDGSSSHCLVPSVWMGRGLFLGPADQRPCCCWWDVHPSALPSDSKCWTWRVSGDFGTACCCVRLEPRNFDHSSTRQDWSCVLHLPHRQRVSLGYQRF